MSEINDGGPTCASCKFIGATYWGDHSDYGGRTHFCLKSDQRRAATMKSTGDFAEDFMVNFRTFFDAKAINKACQFYEEREPLDPARMAVLEAMAQSGGKAAYGFFSDENRLCSSMDGKFVERDEWALRQRKPTDGTRDWMLTKVGEAVVADATRSSSMRSAK